MFSTRRTLANRSPGGSCPTVYFFLSSLSIPFDLTSIAPQRASPLIEQYLRPSKLATLAAARSRVLRLLLLGELQPILGPIFGSPRPSPLRGTLGEDDHVGALGGEVGVGVLEEGVLEVAVRARGGRKRASWSAPTNRATSSLVPHTHAISLSWGTLNTGLPHVPQNLRCIGLPLDVFLSRYTVSCSSFASLVNFNPPCAGTTALSEQRDPPPRVQHRHMQAATPLWGGASKANLPQLQWPLKVDMMVVMVLRRL